MLTPDQLTFLEQTVGIFYGGSQAQIAEADRALDQLRAHSQPYTLLQQLVDSRSSTPAVLWAISLVEQWFKRRRRSLNAEERQACRTVVVGLVLSSASGGEKVVAQKLQHLLAVALKADWPEGWQSFIPDLLAAGLGDSDQLRILLLLAEEAFVSSPASRAVAVQAALAVQGAPLITLCVRELRAAAEANDVERLRAALGLLGRCAPWLAPAAVMPPEVLTLLPPLLGLRAARAVVLKLLHELAAPVRSTPSDQPAPAETAADAAAWRALHATLAEVVGWAEALLAPAQGGGAGVGGILNPREQLELVLLLRAIWSGQRHALCRVEGGGALLGRALRLLTGLVSAAAQRPVEGGGEVDETVAVCLEAAADLALPLPLSAAGVVDATTASGAGFVSILSPLPYSPAEVAAADPALAAAREAALMLLCDRMPRPAAAMMWVEDEEADEIEIEAEIAAEHDRADELDADLARCAQPNF